MRANSDVQVSNLSFDMNPIEGDPPIQLLVYTITARLTDAWLEKMVKLGLAKGAAKMPVEVTYEGSTFTPNGAEVTLKAGAGFLKATATVVLVVTGAGPDKIAVRVAEIKALGRLPVEGMLTPLIEKGIDKANDMPGIERDPAAQRAVLVDPNLLLSNQGIPLTFELGGNWDVSGTDDSLTLTFGR